jgi:hypothetical protein
MDRFMSKIEIIKVIKSQKSGDLLLLCDVPEVGTIFRKLFFDRKKHSKFQRFCRMNQIRCLTKTLYHSDQFYFDLKKNLEGTYFEAYVEESDNPDYPYNIEELFLEC